MHWWYVETLFKFFIEHSHFSVGYTMIREGNVCMLIVDAMCTRTCSTEGNWMTKKLQLILVLEGYSTKMKLHILKLGVLSCCTIITIIFHVTVNTNPHVMKYNISSWRSNCQWLRAGTRSWSGLAASVSCSRRPTRSCWDISHVSLIPVDLWITLMMRHLLLFLGGGLLDLLLSLPLLTLL